MDLITSINYPVYSSSADLELRADEDLIVHASHRWITSGL